MLIDLAGLLAAAVLLIALVVLEVRRAGPGTGQPAHQRLFGRTVSSWAIAVMWMSYLVLFFPRVLGLLT